MRAEAKAGLQPSFDVWEANLQVLRGSELIHTIAHKVQTQGAVTCKDDSKTSKGPTSTPIQDSEPSNKARKDKKKRYQDKRGSREPKDSNTPASKVNAAEVGGKGRRRNKKDVSHITYFNCNKKRHYLNKCPEPPKN